MCKEGGNPMLKIVSIETGPAESEGVYDDLLEWASPDKRDRAARFLHRQDAVNTLVGDLAARSLIGAKTGLPNRSLVFQTGPQGKPYLANDPGIHFNLSHSGDLVVCAVSGQAVGADIERIERKADADAIAKRFFSPDEIAYLAAQDDDTHAAFYQIWTMKESYVKWSGQGLSAPLDSFSVLAMAGKAGRSGGVFFHRIPVRQDACCYVCATAKNVSSHTHYKLSDFMARTEGMLNGPTP